MNSTVRKWLGDVDAAWVLVGRESDVMLARQAFPEAVEVANLNIERFDQVDARWWWLKKRAETFI